MDIPEDELNRLARTLLKALIIFYNDEANIKAFEDWRNSCGYDKDGGIGKEPVPPDKA